MWLRWRHQTTRPGRPLEAFPGRKYLPGPLPNRYFLRWVSCELPCCCKARSSLNWSVSWRSWTSRSSSRRSASPPRGIPTLPLVVDHPPPPPPPPPPARGAVILTEPPAIEDVPTPAWGGPPPGAIITPPPPDPTIPIRP